MTIITKMVTARAGKLCTISVVVLALGAIPFSVLAVPQLPHVFYGNITIDGSPAAVGTVIIAKVGGVEKGRITTTESGKYGGPDAYDAKLLVQGGDLSAGDTVNFTYSDINASETALFDSGALANQNLTFVTSVDGSSANATLSSTASGQAELPSGVTAVKLSNSTKLDLSAQINSVSDGVLTVGGVVKTLSNFTSGNLSGVNLAAAQSIGGKSVSIEKAVVLQSGVDGQPLILTNNDLSSVTVAIPDAAAVLAPAGWNGTIEPPKAAASSGTAPSGFSVGGTVISVGSPDVVLLFDTPVTLTLTGVTGAVGYKPSGSDAWVTISETCSGTYASPGNPTFPGECKITNGTDTKIVTYHFTNFGSLNSVPESAPTPTPTSTPAPSGGGGALSLGTTVTTSVGGGLSLAAQKVDANKDNKIDILDFNVLMVNWGSAITGNAADFNADGRVDVFDFNLLMVNWTV